MLKFKVLNGYREGTKAGHAELEFDTTLEQDVSAAEKEFDRLLNEGRSAITEDGARVTNMPRTGTVFFLLPMQGG